MKRMLLFPIAIFLLGAGAPSHSAGEATNGKNKDAYVIVTDTESNPEELFERYPEISASWDELARFNLLKGRHPYERPGVTRSKANVPTKVLVV